MPIEWSGPKRVAKQLFGKYMVVGDKTVTIRDAEGFYRSEGLRPLYKPMLTMDPGSVYCPQFGRTILLVIAVLDRKKPGGRVLIREIQYNGSVISGPAKVAQYLGITESRRRGTTTWIDDTTFRIDWLE